MTPERTHYEAQIKRFAGDFDRDFDAAVDKIVSSRKLWWFTDSQIAEIRDEMIMAELRRRRSAAASRKIYAARINTALASVEPHTEETA